jgi:hypothetical protein
MQGPIVVTFKGIKKTHHLENLIHKKTAKLEQICNRMTSCRITVEMANQCQRIGNPFRVNIGMAVPPGHELTVKHKSGEGDLHDQLPNVLSDAFSTAGRQLKELAQRQQGEMKKHIRQQL